MKRMSLNVVYYGNETLKKVAQEVKNVDDDVIKFIEEMYEVMYLEKGIGLAAPQVDVSKRVIIIDTNEKSSSKIAMINPEIIEVSGDLGFYEEGCLSVPGISEEIERPLQVMVKGLNLDGKEIRIEADGLLARAFQHEVDHLNGILFIDHLEDYIRNEYRKELKKIKRMNKK